jgi:HAD-superfamily hydrolase, subfamily IIIA
VKEGKIMAYTLAVFDLDGTVLDTLRDLTDSTNAALRMNQLPQRSMEEVRAFVGNGIAKLIARAVPEGTDDALREKTLNDFKAHYALHKADATRPYEGIPELLTALRAAGIRTAVVSNKADAAVRGLVEMFFPQMFDFCVGERENVRKKPAPDAVLEAMDALGASRAETVYIGDSDVDVETARNAGVDCVAVTWGFRDVEVLKKAGATVIAGSAQALWDALT